MTEQETIKAYNKAIDACEDKLRWGNTKEMKGAWDDVQQIKVECIKAFGCCPVELEHKLKGWK